MVAKKNLTIEQLAKRIEQDIIPDGYTRGTIEHRGGGKRGGTDYSRFLYDFTQGTLTHRVPCDGEEGIELLEIGMSQLTYHLKDPQIYIKIIDETSSSIKIQIYKKPQETKNPLPKKPNLITSFYLKCEREGISPEESGDPFKYDEGRNAWLEQN